MAAAVHATNPSLHAIVIGAGPEGLAFAEVLGLRLERVTLIARHDIPDHGAPGDTACPARPAAALRRVLDAPRVVVRPGLEVVALVLCPDRVRGVAVRPRRGGAREPVTILADLVVDATGWRHLVASRAVVTASALGRCLDLHLARRAGLCGFSAVAQRAVAGAAHDLPVPVPVPVPAP
ncbi:MAG: hypothetical protein PV358_13895 [Acidimicrobiales bacterium]|nr:hypothetical protein [Acidimicrobiales bacterium]